MAENPCCAALLAKCKKLAAGKKNFREGCHLLQDQLAKSEAHNVRLKKAYDEEHARADHERELKEKEVAIKISVESKVVDMESELSSLHLQLAGYPQLENLEKELTILQRTISEREAERDRFKQLFEEETTRTNVERENAKVERQKAMELNEALEAQKSKAKEICGSPQLENLEKELMILQRTVSEREAEIDRLNQLLEEETTKTNVERQKTKVERQKAMELNEALEAQKSKAKETCACNLAEGKTIDDSESKMVKLLEYKENADEKLTKQLEEETMKVDLLQKEVLALKSFHESAESGFAMEFSKKEAELECLRDLLEVDKSRADAEQKKVAALQETLKLEKKKSLKSSNLTKQLKEETVKVDLLQKEVLALKSFRESAESGFAMEFSKKEAELERLRDLLEVDKSRADAMQKKVAALQETLELEKMKSLKSSNLTKQLKEETVKVDLLQKEVLALKSFHESAEAGFAMECSKKEAELERLRDLLEVDKSRADAEQKKVAALQETLALEKMKSLKSSTLAQAESKIAKENLIKMEKLQNEVSKLTMDQSKTEDVTKMYEAEKKNALRERQHADAEKVKASELKNLAEENEKRFMLEKSNYEQLSKQLEEERQKADTLQKQVQELVLCAKSTPIAHPDISELRDAYSKLESEHKSLKKENKHIKKVKGQELKRIAAENDKKVMEVQSNSKQLAQQMEAERQTVKMLQKQVQELLSTAKSTASDHSSYLKLKQAYSKLEDQNRMFIRERKCIEADMMGELDNLRKLSETNEKRHLEEKCRADRLSYDLHASKQKIDELEKELHIVKLSRKPAENSSLPTVPDAKISTPILLHEKLKLEKKRVKHAKQVVKLEKYRSDVLQRELGKFKQDFIRSVQHLDMLENTFCGGAHAVDNSIKSADLSKWQSLYLNKILLGKLEEVLAVPGSSARCASDSDIQEVRSKPCNNSTQSPSHITNVLLPLIGGGLREISPSSAMDSSAASFHDKKLLGSQLQVAGSLAKSTIMVDEYTKPLATISKISDQAGKRKHRAHASAVVNNSSGSPLDSLCPHSRKRRKLLKKFESLNSMQIESRRMHEELENKLSKVNSKLNKLTPVRMENAGFLLPDRVAAQQKGPRKKEVSHKLEETLDHSLSLDKQIEGNLLLAPAPLPAEKERGSTQPRVDHTSDQITMLEFEQQIQGNAMRLLELDNKADEELFRTAIENPLSPTLPKINCENGIPTNRVFSSDCAEKIDERIILSAPIAISDRAEQTDSYQWGMNVKINPLFCILFSCMKDTIRISMMLIATRRCLTKCRVHSQTERILMELINALASERQLTPREKACVFFSIIMQNFLQVSSNESEVYFKSGSLCTFSLDLCSVLSDVKSRSNLADLFCFSELFYLFENFVCQRRIVVCGDKDLEANQYISRFDIRLEGKKAALYKTTASMHQVFAGSLIISSLCLAVGQISILWNFSVKVLQMWPADTELILYILHGFAFVCGEKYLLTSHYQVQMEVVKSMVNVLEGVHGETLSQSDRKNSHRFAACARCPFAKSLQPCGVLSMLVEELRKGALMPMDGVDPSSGLSIPDNVPDKEIYGYIDKMSSVELISIIMGWSWTTDNVLPELQKLLPFSTKGKFSTSLVLLLGRLGRFGVKSCGYEDAGVESLNQFMSSLFAKHSASEHNHKFDSALFLALDGITQHRLDYDTGLSAASTSIRKCYSSLSIEQKDLNIALNHPLGSK